ncbi:retrotransposon protein, putative, ty1-copia subclass [Tanacetum coccineum]
MDTTQEEVAPVHRYVRTHRAPERLCLNVEVENHSLGDLNEPANYKDALIDPESNKWLNAINVDIKGLYSNPYGIDYEETFSHIVDIIAIRILIAIVTFYDYEIWQMDVKTAFLNGYIVEDIYMMQPGDLGEAAFILGIKNYQDRSKRLIGLSQSAYMDKILKRFRMDNPKRGNIPMQERFDLNKTQGSLTPKEVKRMQNVLYASTTGKAPSKVLLQCPLQKLNIIETAMEVVWIRKFISGLGIVPTINEPINMLCDNSAALLITNKTVVQRGARHYHRRYHYVHEFIELGEINLLKVHKYDNLVDPFTKALPKRKLTQHARSIGLHLASSFM